MGWLVLLFAAGPPTPAFGPAESLRLPADVVRLSYAPDGKRLAVIEWTGPASRVALLDPATGKTLARLTGLGGHPVALSFRPDGKELAALSGDGRWAVWDVARGVRLRSGGTEDPEAWVESVVRLSADGKTLRAFCGGRWGSWDTTTGVVSVGGKGVWCPHAILGLSPDAERMAVRGITEGLDLHDVATGGRVASFRGLPGPVSDAVFTADGRSVLAVSDDLAVEEHAEGRLFLLDVRRRRVVRSVSLGEGRVDRLLLSPAGKTLAAFFPRDGRPAGEIRLFDVPGLGEVGRCAVKRVQLAAFRPDGRVLAVLLIDRDGNSRTVRLLKRRGVP